MIPKVPSLEKVAAGFSAFSFSFLSERRSPVVLSILYLDPFFPTVPTGAGAGTRIKSTQPANANAAAGFFFPQKNNSRIGRLFLVRLVRLL